MCLFGKCLNRREGRLLSSAQLAAYHIVPLCKNDAEDVIYVTTGYARWVKMYAYNICEYYTIYMKPSVAQPLHRNMRIELVKRIQPCLHAFKVAVYSGILRHNMLFVCECEMDELYDMRPVFGKQCPTPPSVNSIVYGSVTVQQTNTHVNCRPWPWQPSAICVISPYCAMGYRPLYPMVRKYPHILLIACLIIRKRSMCAYSLKHYYLFSHPCVCVFIYVSTWS